MNKSANFLAKWLGTEHKNDVDDQNNTNQAKNINGKQCVGIQQIGESDIDSDYHLQIPMPPLYEYTSSESDCEAVIPFPPNIKNRRHKSDTFSDDDNTEIFENFYKSMKHIVYSTELTNELTNEENDDDKKDEKADEKAEISPLIKFTLFYKCGHCHLNGTRNLIKNHPCKVKVKTKMSGWYKCLQCDVIKSNKKLILTHISEKHASTTNKK
eukprot:UN02461